MNRFTRLFSGAAFATAIASNLWAADIFWNGGTGGYLDPNYSDGTPTLRAPGGGDIVHIGADGVVTFVGDGNARGVGKLRVGHSQPTSPGQGTLTFNNGAQLELTVGAAGADNASLWVGAGVDGTLNLEDNSSLTLLRLGVIGYGNDATKTGTLNIKTGGSLNVSDGNLLLSDRAGTTGTGVQGVVNISGATSKITVSGGGADLVLANRQAKATYTQTDGIVSINDAIDVAPQSGSSTGTTFNVSGGTLTSGTGTGATSGNFFVGRGSSVGATVNISGTATVNVGNRFLMGGSNGTTPPTAVASGVVTNHSGGTLNTDLDIRVADAFISPTSDATYNLSGTGVINSTTGGVIGRQGTGKFIQTGGIANFNGTVAIANRETATTTTTNGLYKISAGDLNITGTVPTPPATAQVALSIAANGTGEFRVVGDDATIDLTGDLVVNSTANGVGKFAYELETGDLLSMVNVSGTATFSPNSILAFDTTNAAPTQTSYDLLTATSITTMGMVFSGPAGWNFEVVTSGSNQILRVLQTGPPVLVGDYNQNGKVDGADYVVWRKTNINGAQGYTDWRANFGNGSPGSGMSASQAVPEPATALVAIAAIAIGSGLRVRRVQ